MNKYRAALLLLIVAFLIDVALIAYGTYVLIKSWEIDTDGEVFAIGIQVTWDANATNNVTSFSWGRVQVGGNKSILVYLTNNGWNANITANVTSLSYDPPEIAQELFLTWNYTGEIIQENQTIPVLLTLTVDPDIPRGFTEFSFDVLIEADEP